MIFIIVKEREYNPEPFQANETSRNWNQRSLQHELRSFLKVKNILKAVKNRGIRLSGLLNV